MLEDEEEYGDHWTPGTEEDHARRARMAFIYSQTFGR